MEIEDLIDAKIKLEADIRKYLVERLVQFRREFGFAPVDVKIAILDEHPWCNVQTTITNTEKDIELK